MFGVESNADVFRYADPLAALFRDSSAAVWFHIELWEGVLAEEDSVAGVIQLRCQTKSDPKAVVGKFRAARQLQEGEKYLSKIKAKSGSFFLLVRPLLKRHLTSTQFCGQLDLFAATGKTVRKAGKMHLSAGIVRVQVALEWRRKGVGRFLVDKVGEALIHQFSQRAATGRLRLHATVNETWLPGLIFLRAWGSKRRPTRNTRSSSGRT